MNKITFLIPIYPPHFKYAENIIKTWEENKLNTQSDIWFVFTNEEEKEKYGEWENSIILPQKLRIFKNKGIINIKKLYGIKQLKDQYEYIIVIDAESEFIKNIDLLDMCEEYFNRKILLGNKILDTSPCIDLINKIKKCCIKPFKQYKKVLNTSYYLWFNNPCIYKSETLNDFFEKINLRKTIKNLKFEDFDYYLYMNYLQLFQNFKVEDIGIEAEIGALEVEPTFLNLKKANLDKYSIYMCSNISRNFFENEHLFLVFHIDMAVTLINSTDISVLVQGAIDEKITPICLESIRKYLPNSEIILSTWEHENVDSLDYDILIKNKDQLAPKYDCVLPKPNNCNRQLYSIQQGLLQAKRKYILKLRTDCQLKNTKFLEYFDNFQQRDENYSIFSHRVLNSSIYARLHACFGGNFKYPTPFLISDFWFFGLNEDIQDYFRDCPLMSMEQMSNYSFKYPNKIPYPTPTWQFAPEQYYCVSWVKKYYPDLKFEDWSDFDSKNIELSNNIIFNNFIFLGYLQSGIFCQKHSFAFNHENEIPGIITYELFQNYYKKYCDSNYIVNSVTIKKQISSKIKLKKHLDRLIFPFKHLIAWIGEIFSVIFYLFVLVFDLFKRNIKKGKNDKF